MNKNLNALEDHFHAAWRNMQTLKDAGQSYRAEMNAVNCAVHYFAEAKDDHEARTLKAHAAYGNPHSGCARTFAPGYFREGFTVNAPEHPERHGSVSDALFNHYDALTDLRADWLLAAQDTDFDPAIVAELEAARAASKVALHYFARPVREKRNLENATQTARREAGAFMSRAKLGA